MMLSPGMLSRGSHTITRACMHHTGCKASPELFSSLFLSWSVLPSSTLVRVLSGSRTITSHRAFWTHTVCVKENYSQPYTHFRVPKRRFWKTAIVVPGQTYSVRISREWCEILNQSINQFIGRLSCILGWPGTC